MFFEPPRLLERYLNIGHQPRPIRTAFLVPQSDASSPILRSIFQFSYAQWGGRRNLIIPIEGQKISPNYLAWLKWYDPDVIYTYGELSEDTSEFINRYCCPFLFLLHEQPKHGGTTWVPSLREFEGIRSLSFVPKRVLAMSNSPPKILAHFHGWDEVDIISDNFGVAISNDTRSLFNSFTMTPKGLGERIIVNGDPLFDEYELFGALTTNRNTISLSYLSFIDTHVPVPDHQHTWKQGLNLFIGDGFAERLHFWNAAHLNDQNTYYHTPATIPSFWLGTNYIADDKFIEVFAKWLQANTWSFPSAQGWGANIYVRSLSVNEEALNLFISKLKKFAFNLNFIIETNYVAPCPITFTKQPYYIGYGHNIRTNENPFSFEPEEPEHFQAIPFEYSDLKYGKCAVDVRIERHNNYSNTVNQPHFWQLPLNQNHASQFFGRSSGRINKSRLPSKLYNYFDNIGLNRGYNKKNSIEVRSPQDADIFHLAAAQGAFPPFISDLRSETPKAYERLEISDKGQALKGVLSLFGGLNNAFHFLSNPFWRNVFEEAASLKKLYQNEEATTRIKQSLIKQMGEKAIISSEAEWSNLVSKIMPALYHLPQVRLPFTYEELKSMQIKSFNEYLTLNPERPDFKTKEARNEATQSFERNLSYLVEKKVMFQGTREICSECGHPNWIAVNDTQLNHACGLCGYAWQISVRAPGWSFMLNSKIGDALYKDDLISEVLTLGLLLRNARSTFYFLPQSKLYKNEGSKNPNAEIDIICMHDSQFILGETKTNCGQFTPTVLKKIATVANAMKADKVILSYMYDNESYRSNLENSLSEFQCPIDVIDILSHVKEPNPWS